MIFALGKILTTIALSIGTVGAIGCLILGAIVTVNLYVSLFTGVKPRGGKDKTPGDEVNGG